MAHTWGVRVAGVLLALIPALAAAHSPAGLRAEFTPAERGAPFARVMTECVQDADAARARRHSGLGDERYPLVALGPSAEQAAEFYSQGFVLQYAFNFPASIRSFDKARSLDPGAAMPYWGIALAANSNINSAATHGCNRLSYLASQIAVDNARARLADPAAQSLYRPDQLAREVAYAEAFVALFERAGQGKIAITEASQRRYVEQMRLLAARFSDDLDAATLYAAALLSVDPWKWWKGTASTSDEVTPTPETDIALQVLNKVLTSDARHSGANHFFIHALEESPFSESGRPMAERLPKLVPASGHLVHMASHIFQRVGDNAAASAANYSAVAVDRAFVSQGQASDVYPLHYLGHNIHFLTWTLSIEGRRDESLNMARELVQNTLTHARNGYLCRQFSEEIQIKSDYFFAVPFMYAVRFQDWEYLDRMIPVVEESNAGINATCRAETPGWREIQKPYTGAMLAYARAYRALREAAPSADAGLEALSGFWATARETLVGNAELRYGNNRALELFRIANVALLARALGDGRKPGAIALDVLRERLRASLADGPGAALHRDLDGARGGPGEVIIALWQKGVEVQDALDYNEPPDWYYTVRESLGYAHLAQGQFPEAERVFTADLRNNRGGGRSLQGLKTSLERQKKPVPSWLTDQLTAAWRNATVSPAP